jgi:rSAM/selenodomain-associated transferase 1
VFATTPPPVQRLLVFARLPELGKVKTRLAEGIGPEKALAVYEAMLRDLLQSLSEAPAPSPAFIEILWAPTPTASGDALRRAFSDHSLAMQTGATLGDRLAMAFSERFFFHGAKKLIAIGVDDPRLTRDAIDHAFSLLDSCDWVVGPARDGGYYLIGCRAAVFNSELFIDIPWGTSSVLQMTLDRIRGQEHTVALLPERYDIDVVEDLQRFALEIGSSDGELPRLLRAWGMAA